MSESRISRLFQEKKSDLLSVYFCAGHPAPETTLPILRALQEEGIDMVEVGIPFSDPLADGPVIQHASSQALKQGMSLQRIFDELKDFRAEIRIPVILMGYLNPILHYGFERFCNKCRETGIDAIIIPDLPYDLFLKDYADMAAAHDLPLVFLVTPETSEERIREIDDHSQTFIYAVSSAAVTGAQKSFDERKEAYFQRLKALNLKNPFLVGFGISNKATRTAAAAHSAGVIVGSRFVTLLEQHNEPRDAVKALLQALNE